MKRNWGDLGLYYERTYIYVSLIELDFFCEENKRARGRRKKVDPWSYEWKFSLFFDMLYNKLPIMYFLIEINLLSS
jgi:hypothetical protein